MELPAFLTVPEAARFLRIGRTAAYDLANRYERTGGADGLPVVRIGRALRVPRARLEELAGCPLGPAPTPALATARPSKAATTAPVDAPQLTFPPTAA